MEPNFDDDTIQQVDQNWEKMAIKQLCRLTQQRPSDVYYIAYSILKKKPKVVKAGRYHSGNLGGTVHKDGSLSLFKAVANALGYKPGTHLKICIEDKTQGRICLTVS